VKTVRDLIRELSGFSKELKNKPITIFCSNGLSVYPEIRTRRTENYDLTSPIEEIVLSWN
jgi:hypothetical protein